MAKILANDGLSASGVEALESYGYEVSTTNVAQEQLEKHINSNEIDVLLVRSCLLYTSPSPRDISGSRMPSSA